MANGFDRHGLPSLPDESDEGYSEEAEGDIVQTRCPVCDADGAEVVKVVSAIEAVLVCENGHEFTEIEEPRDPVVSKTRLVVFEIVVTDTYSGEDAVQRARWMVEDENFGASRVTILPGGGEREE